MDLGLRGRRALVTGASKGIGRAIAHELAAEGVDLALCARGKAVLEEAAGEALGAGVRVFARPLDVTDPDDVRRFVEEAAAALGGLDIVVNSAAIMERRPLAEITPADWDRTMDLNLRGAFFVAKGAAAVLAEQGGVIVNIADLAAFERWRGYPAHCISKAGVVAMTELLAKALAPRVRVNAVAPGAVLLPHDWEAAAKERLVSTTPLGRLGGPDDVVAAVTYLIERDYVTGETLVVDGGRRVR